MITLSVTIHCKLDQVEKARDLFRSFVPRARSETGCLLYVLTEGEIEFGLFHFYEQWETQAALDAHNQQDYLKEFHARFEELLQTKNQVHRLRNCE